MFNPASLRQFLLQFPSVKTFWVAYSGGMDSHVLLHALATMRHDFPECAIKAIHVNHQLSPHATQWEQHCRAVCTGLNVPFHSVVVDAKPGRGNSPEAAARTARYNALAEILTANDALLTAHHHDDQAETLLLQLFRGAGLRGLAAMAEYAPFAKGYLLRPLLNVSRADLTLYAALYGLQWVHDESNDDLRFDRNFLRNTVMPQLQQRWANITTTIARAADHCAEAEQLLQTLAEQDLVGLAGTQPQTLSISRLSNLQPSHRHNVLRYWFRNNHFSMPSTAQLSQLEETVLWCRTDAMPRLAWGNTEVRRYRDDLYIYPREQIAPLTERLAWDNLSVPLALPNQVGILQAQLAIGKGIRIDERQKISIRFRQGGEQCQPRGRKETHTLKKLFQEWAVPPWLRKHIPLLYLDEQIASIIGYCDCEPFIAQGDQQGWIVSYTNNWLTVHAKADL